MGGLGDADHIKPLTALQSNLLLPDQPLCRPMGNQPSSCWSLSDPQNHLLTGLLQSCCCTSSKTWEPTHFGLRTEGPPTSQELNLAWVCVFQIIHSELELHCNWKTVLEKKQVGLEESKQNERKDSKQD